MASQTGSIDLTASNGVKLMAEAGFTNAERAYATKSALDVQADRISMVVENSDASGDLTLTADALEYIGDHVEIKGTDGTSTVISGGQIQAGSLSIGSLDSSTQTAISNGERTAKDYVTYIDDNGITVHPKRSDYATNGGRAVINADGLTIYLGSDNVASYGASARIGKANSDRVTVDSTNGITIYKGNSKRLQTTANGIDVYGNDGTTSVASFGSTARLGSISSGNYLVMNANGLNLYNELDGTNYSSRIGPSSVSLLGGDFTIASSIEGGTASTFYDTILSENYSSSVKTILTLRVTKDKNSGSTSRSVMTNSPLYVTGQLHSTGGVYPSDNLAGLTGSDTYIYLRASTDENKWRFSKSNRTVWWYDGTEWDAVCPMPAMTAAISGQTDTNLTVAYANLTLAAVTTVASTLSISGGGIKCAKAGRVMISGAAYFTGVSAGNVCNLRVLNGSTVSAFVSDRAYSDRCQMVIPPRITTVAAGDVLYMAVANTSAATGSVDGTRTQTWLTVQYVAYN